MKEWHCSCEKCEYNHTDGDKCEVCVNFSNFVRLQDKKVELIEELKPCPFCGSDIAKLEHRKVYLVMYSYVRCPACGASTKEIAISEKYSADIKAVAAWNTRKAVKEEEE